MHNESITELLCSPLQDSPTNEVKAMYNSYVIELVRSTDPFRTKNKVNTMDNI